MGRQEFLDARLAYIDEMNIEGETLAWIAAAVQLDDYTQVRLLIKTARERRSPPAPTTPPSA